MTFRLSSTSKSRLDGVNPELIQVIDYALILTKVDFGIPEFGGLRTSEQQNKLFRAGKSQLNGYSKLSNHQTGNAFDIFAYVDNKASWDKCHLGACAGAILAAASQLEVPLMWGGLWKNFEDYPHFELSKGKKGVLK